MQISHVSLWLSSVGKALKSLFMDPKHEAPSHSELLTAISSSQCEYSVVNWNRLCFQEAAEELKKNKQASQGKVMGINRTAMKEKRGE